MGNKGYIPPHIKEFMWVNKINYDEVKRMKARYSLSIADVNEILTIHDIRSYCYLTCKDCMYSDVCKEHPQLLEMLLNYRDKDVKGLEYVTTRLQEKKQED